MSIATAWVIQISNLRAVTISMADIVTHFMELRRV